LFSAPLATMTTADRFGDLGSAQRHKVAALERKSLT